MLDPWSPRRMATTVLLLLACLGLGLLIDRAEWRAAPVLAAGPRVPVPTVAGGQEGRGFTMPPLSSYAEVLRRPLFASTRRPSPGLAGAEEDSAGPFTLLGITTAPGARVALVAQGSSGTLLRLGEGQGLDGWTVAAIGPDTVLLRQGAAERKLKLRDRRSGVAASSRPGTSTARRLPHP